MLYGRFRACRIHKSLGYTLNELKQDPMDYLQVLLRAVRCLPHDVTLLKDVQHVWNTTDCQASFSRLAAQEPERAAVRTRFLVKHTSVCLDR